MKIFSKNSRVCFVGDSITHNNGYLMHIVSYYKNNFPDLNINFYNCGVSGSNLSVQLEIAEKDTLSFAPTHVVILMGINDCERERLLEKRSEKRYEMLKQAFENYKSNLEKLCGLLKKRNIDITLCTCIPYDEYGEYCTSPLHGGLALIMAYNEYIREYARRQGHNLCDLFPYILEQMQKERIYSDDSVHVTDKGQFYIARCFLKNQGLDLCEETVFSEKLLEWNGKVQILRNIYAVESLVIKKYNLPYSDALLTVKNFMESDECNDWFNGICRCYLENKQQEKQIKAHMTDIMEKEL